MKKIIVALALAVCSSVSMAQTVTTACSPGNTTVVNVPGKQDGTLFVRTTFAPTCSANSVVQVSDDAVKVWGVSASVKGQSIFGGSTNGGTVGNLGPCNSGKACGTPADTLTAIQAQDGKAKALGNT